MASPSETFCEILQRFDSGETNEDQFHHELDQLEHFVASHHDRLFELSQPEGDLGDDAPLMRETVTTCFAAFFEAIELVRQYPEERSSELRSMATGLCGEAGEHIVSLIEMANSSLATPTS